MDDISIVIPTLNRSDYVIKMLKYFCSTDFSGHILIGDSSNSVHVERTRKAIEVLRPQFKITYREYPGLKNYQCIRDLLLSVETSYVLWMCDDDILIPSTLRKCADFLENNPEYSGVGGTAIIYGLMNDGAYGDVLWAHRYRVDSIEDDTSAKRLFHLLTDYSVVGYCLCRTGQFKRKFLMPQKDKLTDVAMAGELLPCAMLVAQGKVKMLDSLFVARQLHNERYILPDLFEWITKPDWRDAYIVLHDCLVSEITANDRTPLEEARALVKQAFWFYLAAGLKHKYNSCYCQAKEPALKTRIKKFLKNSPRLYKYLSVLRHNALVQKYRQSVKGGISFEGLLKTSSPYHRDFMPLYNIIIAPNKGVK